MQKTSKSELDKALDLIEESGVDLSKMFERDGILKQLTKGLVQAWPTTLAS